MKVINLHIQEPLKLRNWNTYKEHHPWAHQSKIAKDQRVTKRLAVDLLPKQQKTMEQHLKMPSEYNC